MMILDKTPDGERRVIISQNAEFVDAGKEGLRLDMDSAFIHSSKEVAREDFDYATSSILRYRIKQDELIDSGTTITAREMAARDIWAMIQEKESIISHTLNTRNHETLNAALALESALRKGPLSRDWRQRDALLTAFKREYSTSHTLLYDRNLSIYRLEFHKKFSIPFGAFAFIFLAVPLGLLAKKSGQAVGFVLGIMISVVYWVLLLGGQNMGLRLGTSPFWSMWLPNILTVLTGFIMLLYRIRK
jgi:lipopolysaccharide export system permease protein